MAASHARLAVFLALAGCGGSVRDGGSRQPLGSTPLDCVNYINSLRATKGLPALARWEDAESCANDQAQNDSASGTAHGAFNDCGEYAQNECPGWPGLSSIVPGCLDMMWAEGPGGGHYENMTSTRFTKVACGFYGTSRGEVWAVQDFR